MNGETSKGSAQVSQLGQINADGAGQNDTALVATSAEGSYPLDSFEWQEMTFGDLCGMLIFVALMANLGAICVQTLLRSMEWV